MARVTPYLALNVLMMLTVSLFATYLNIEVMSFVNVLIERKNAK